MNKLAMIGALLMASTPSLAQANRYFFCSAFGQTGNNGVPGWRYAQVMGGVVVTRDGYRTGEGERMKRDFERVVKTRFERATDLVCYNHAASDRSTRELIAKSAEAYRIRGEPFVIVDFNRDYTGGVPSGASTSRAQGVYFAPPKSSAPTTPTKPRADGLTEPEIRRRDAAADAELARINTLYAQQRARQEAEYARVKRENANRQATHQAQIAKQRSEYNAMLAAREAQAAKARAEWEARVARCKAGDRKSCASQAIER